MNYWTRERIEEAIRNMERARASFGERITELRERLRTLDASKSKSAGAN